MATRRNAATPQLGLELTQAAGTIVRLCGVDEAGRGPLAGPVYAAAVVLDPARQIRGLADSKVLTAEKREVLFARICERALGWHIAFATVEEIDRLNIFHATMLAMQRAVQGLAASGVIPDLVQVDGNRCPQVAYPVEAIVKGDAKIRAISAASILAKVARDRELMTLHEAYPQYGFDSHVGYGTPQHLAALQQFGATPHHRRTFAPVRAVLQGTPLDLSAIAETAWDDADDEDAGDAGDGGAAVTPDAANGTLPF